VNGIENESSIGDIDEDELGKLDFTPRTININQTKFNENDE